MAVALRAKLEKATSFKNITVSFGLILYFSVNILQQGVLL